MSNSDQLIVSLIGPDRCGKTQIAMELSRQTGAQYLINCPGLGHVKSPKSGVNGVYINYEAIIDEAR